MQTPTQHRVHGLDGDRIAPDWPPLQTSEVRRILQRFPRLRGPIRINWRSPRPLSAAARVHTQAGEVFVKRQHASVRDPDSLAVEHAFIAHLRKRGIPIPEVFADVDGNTAVADGCWTWEVHALATGVDVYRDLISWAPLTDLGHARTAGRMLAKLHRAAEGFQSPRDTFILVSRDDLLRAPNLIDAIESQWLRRPALASYLGRRDWRHELAPLAARQQALQPRLAELPRLWTHNDWHASNLCWSDATSRAGITDVLDFGLAAPTFALYDLATAIERNAIAWMQLDAGMQAIHPDTTRALIDGYAEALPLRSADRQLLAELLPVVHIDFALSEVEYFNGITHSAEHADVAYHTFLRGHAGWFDTPPGQVLLDALRQTGR